MPAGPTSVAERDFTGLPVPSLLFVDRTSTLMVGMHSESFSLEGQFRGS